MDHMPGTRSGGDRPEREQARRLAGQGDQEFQRGQTKAAQSLYEQALAADPACPEALCSYGYFLLRLGRAEEAERTYQQALEAAPDHVDAQVKLGLLYLVRQRPEDAAAVLQKAALSQPGSGNLQVHLADVYWALRRIEEAEAALTAAVKNEPGLIVEVSWRRARILEFRKQYEEAGAEARRAIRLAPSLIHPRVTLAGAQLGMGLTEEAIETLREAVRLSPGYMEAHLWLLFLMNYHSQYTPEILYEEAKRWEKECIAPVVRAIAPHENTPEPERRLRIGYVSADLRLHVVARFIRPVLENHDRSQVEVYAYYLHPEADPVSHDIRRKVDRWRHVPRCNGEDLAERIRADGIDVLVDLGGHTGWVLHALALKPAPVQATWIGLLNTTGLSAMDYLLGDAHMPAPGTEHCFSEKVYRLPRSLGCYRPGDLRIPVAPAPCRQRGHITFGSFNNPNKVTREVIRLWAAILHLVPESRLLLQYYGLGDERLRRVYREWFGEDGIDAGRIEMQEAAPLSTYLSCYNEVDIALDPFPYNGGSTTLDALWMGVPVVSLAGRTAVQRCGASLLSAAGLSDFVARTPEQYVRIAMYLAKVIPSAPEFRHEIREALRTSAWMDEAGITRDVEKAYREMWREWCRSQRNQPQMNAVEGRCGTPLADGVPAPRVPA
jgi:predicted O-linked N-acetylglucosamine transferase (SPINDLY family)